MSLTWEKVKVGADAVIHLDAFPIFCGYLLMIALAGKWKKISKPLELRAVSTWLSVSDHFWLDNTFILYYLC